MAAESFFTWGAGGAKLTPEQIALARQLLARKNAQGADTSPVGHWTQGAARVADALGDVLQEKRLNSQEKDLTDYNSGLISNLLTGGGASSAGSSIPSPGAAAEVSATSPAVDISGDQKTFIDSLLPAAIEEGKRTGVDPRIIVAQAAQETGWGKSAPGNNYFGIKSHGQDGGNSLMTTEYVNGAPVKVKDSFRAYQNPADSVRGYGDFILQNPRYEGLRNAQGLDAQLEALQASGYATDPNYSRSVGAIARGIQLPNEVASLDPSAGAPAAPPQNASDAINAYAPQQGAPALPPPTTVAAAPPVASVPAVAPAPVQAPAPNMQVAQDSGMSGQTLANAMKVLSDPRANANTKAIAEIMVRQAQARQQAILEQQLKQSDPAYQQGLQKGAIELDNLRNPKMSPSEAANLKLNQDKFTADTANNSDKLKLDREKFEAELQKGQWQKLTDGRLYNQTSGEFRDAPPPVPGSTPPKMDDISGMRKEIQQLPSYKNLAQAAPIYKAMAETAGRNSKASDLNLVYGLGKIMDPTSVVREGEMVMVKNTASLPDWLQGAIASLNGGAALTPETRQAIMTEAYGRVKGYNDEFTQNMGQYEGIVQRNGINRADVIPDVDKFEPWKAEATPGGPAQIKSVEDYQGLKPGTQYIDPNGKLRTKR
jgi:hypothetical protein